MIENSALNRKECHAEDLAARILLCCRNELYSFFPFLDGAFASLPCKACESIHPFGTEGEVLWYNPRDIAEIYVKNPCCIRGGFLHLMLHCLYLHPFRRGPRDEKRWNLACDIFVEQLLKKINHPKLTAVPNDLRSQCLEELGSGVRSAEEIYDGLPEAPPEALHRAFCADDHQFWNMARADSLQKWEEILSYTRQNKQQQSKKAGTRAGNATEEISISHGRAYDYRKYLRRFTVPKEEMELDMDSFDAIYYHLGMEMYGNLPLIEPLETREGHKLSQLVIAIDTSGSCSGETVRRFLEETYSILSRRENFFRRMKFYLIQCDCVIQSAVVIHSEQEWKNYSRTIAIHGRGGTDFTPVFRYVEQKRREGDLKELRALLYFTDGDGVYPSEKTDYETAFVFLRKTDKMDAVPSWATILLADDRGSR